MGWLADRWKANRWEVIEVVVLVLVFLVLVYNNLAEPQHFRVRNEAPYQFGSADSFWHASYTQYAYDHGTLKEMPPLMVGGIEGLVLTQPPAGYYLASFFTALFGIPAFSAHMFLVVILYLLTLLNFYFCARRIHRNVALITLPFLTLMSALPWVTSYFWGHHILVMGMFFLSLTFLVLFYTQGLFAYISFGILTAAIALTHTAELMYLVLVGFVYLGISLSKGEKTYKDIKGYAIALVAGILVSVDYLIIFLNSWATQEPPIRLEVVKAYFNMSYVFYIHFKWLWWVMIAAVILIVGWSIWKRRIQAEIAVFGLLFVLGFGIHLGMNRFYDIRFYWPVFIGIIIAYACMLAASILIPKKEAVRDALTTVMCVILLVVFVFTFNTLQSKSMNMLPEAITSWLDLVGKSSPISEPILFVTDTPIPWRVLWISKHPPYVIDLDDKDNQQKIAAEEISTNYKIDIITERFALERRGIFSFGPSQEYDALLGKHQSICAFRIVAFPLLTKNSATAHFTSLKERLAASPQWRVQPVVMGPPYYIRVSSGDEEEDCIAPVP